jgi:hypothetical protein
MIHFTQSSYVLFKILHAIGGHINSSSHKKLAVSFIQKDQLYVSRNRERSVSYKVYSFFLFKLDMFILLQNFMFEITE